MKNYELTPEEKGEINHEEIFENVVKNNNQRPENQTFDDAGRHNDEERDELKRQIEEEKAKTRRYEFLLSRLGENGQNPKHAKRNSAPHEVTDEMKQQYEQIFNNYGVDAANNWIKQQLVTNHLNVQMDNEAVCREIQQKYAEVYSNPSVREAIQAYIGLDLDPNCSLREQGLDMAMDYISSIYRAGYEAGTSLKAQNNSAKSRMGSSINYGVPDSRGGRAFTREEIKAMNPETFLMNEKAIFDQLNKGLIR